MRLEPTTIARAFEAFDRKYVRKPKGKKGWEIKHHADLYRWGRAARDAGDAAAFRNLHDCLHSYWQIGRGKNVRMWDCERIFDALRRLPPELSSLTLQTLTRDHIGQLRVSLEDLSRLKRTSSGPSIMAISKFLHFWNPNLFLIVDRGLIWNWVLNHGWIFGPIGRVRDRLDQELRHPKRKHSSGSCDLVTYAAVTLWAGEFTNAHPGLMPAFADYVQSKTDPDTAAEIAGNQTTAVEWLLLGLVELPPHGVCVDQTSISTPTELP